MSTTTGSSTEYAVPVTVGDHDICWLDREKRGYIRFAIFGKHELVARVCVLRNEYLSDSVAHLCYFQGKHDVAKSIISRFGSLPDYLWLHILRPAKRRRKMYGKSNPG